MNLFMLSPCVRVQCASNSTHDSVHPLPDYPVYCVRSSETGEILEGGESEIKMNRYFLVFQREFVEEEGVLQWKLAELSPSGSEDWAI